MRKLLALLLAAAMLTTLAAAAFAQEEKALKLSTVLQENIGDKVPYPWQNMLLTDSMMFRTLFFAEPDLVTLKDDLAKADYKLSEDSLVYTIEFIDGSRWSDGEAITINDVVFSIKTNMRAAITNGIFANAFNCIKGAEAWKKGEAEDLEGIKTEGNTLTITLSKPYNAFAATLAQFAILPEHCLKDQNPLEMHNAAFWTNPVTSGMYKLSEMNVGNYYVLVPNEHYAGTAPKIQKVINYFVTDQVTAAQSGQMDYFNTNSPGVIGEMQKLSSMTMFPVDILFYRYFICNMKGVDGNENPVMQDKRVREAILYAIDREELAKNLFPGLAHVVNSGVPGDYPENSGKVYEYNPEKAKQLLKEANYDFSHKFRILYYYSDQVSIDFMEAIAYYLGEIGMDVTVVNTKQGTTDLFQTRNYDVGYKGLSAFNIGEWFNEYSSANANFSNIFGGDTAFDELNAAFAAAGNAEETSEALKALEEKEHELMYKIPLFTIGNNVFVNTDHVKLPEGIVFGNPWYRTNIQIENWELK